MSQLRIRPRPARPADTVRPAGPCIETTPPVAVFDLDGTLVDTAPDLAASLNHCLRKAGLDEIALDTIRPHAGKGVGIMLDHAYAAAGVPLSIEIRTEQTACFLAHYEAHIADRSRPFPGAVAALDRLATAGYRLAVCTNKVERLSRRLLDEIGLTDRFSAICGADTFPRRKPDPIHLLGTVERAGGTPSSAIMIGDTATDIDAAWACAMPSILVDFGYAPDPLARQRASVVVSRFDELQPALLEKLGAQAHRRG